jgi:hypothetical protein
MSKKTERELLAQQAQLQAELAATQERLEFERNLNRLDDNITNKVDSMRGWMAKSSPEAPADSPQDDLSWLIGGRAGDGRQPPPPAPAAEAPAGPDAASMDLTQYSDIRNQAGMPGQANPNGFTRRPGIQKASSMGMFGEDTSDPYAMAKMVRAAQESGAYNRQTGLTTI